jgi:hypothetical protein
MTDTERGEHLVRESMRVIHRWGEPGLVILLDLIESGEIEDHYTFMNHLKHAAQHSHTFLKHLQRQAAAGHGTSQQVLADLLEEEERRNLDGLALRFSEEIFPEGWPMSTQSVAAP